MKNVCYLSIFLEISKKKTIAQRRKLAESAVDVMLTIFCDFCQFSAKKLAFFSKTNVMINFFSKFGFVLSQKRQFFRQIFRRKYFKNHNIGPWSP
jgi:hypothetical protein